MKLTKCRFIPILSKAALLRLSLIRLTQLYFIGQFPTHLHVPDKKSSCLSVSFAFNDIYMRLLTSL